MTDAHCHCHLDESKAKPFDFCSYATNNADWQTLASFECKYKAFGLHPWYADESLDGLEDFLDGAVALGEIGLDYLRKSAPSKEVQIEKFKAQLELAKAKSLPITIHSVGAVADTLELLEEHFAGRKGRILFHFANFIPDKKGYMEESYFSFSRKSFEMKKPMLLLEKLAPKNILIETDSLPNEADLAFCLEKISQSKGLGIKELEFIVDNNFKRFYQL